MMAGSFKPRSPHRYRTERIPLTAFILRPCFIAVAPGACVQALFLNPEKPSRSLSQIEESIRCTGDQRVVHSTFIGSHNLHIHINQKSANRTSEAELQSVLINLGFTF